MPGSRFIVANWKMGCSGESSLSLLLNFFKSLLDESPAYNSGVSVVFCPPYVYLHLIGCILNAGGCAPAAQRLGLRVDSSKPSYQLTALIDAVRKHHPLLRFALGGQDVSEHPDFGSFTGQINHRMLADLGCEYSIVGHSECRAAAPLASINKKISSLLQSNITPILCVGESISQRSVGTYSIDIIKQIQDSLASIGSTEGLIIAYEPLWSIGSGRTPTPGDIKEIVDIIKKHYPGIRLLYGGSVNASNVGQIVSIEGVDGVLVGAASLNATEFAKITMCC